jgi:fucose permease
MRYTYKHTLKACYLGYITQAIVNNLAPLLFVVFQNEFAISFEKIGRLILMNFATQILVDLFAVRYADKIGHRRLAVVAHGFCAVGLASMGILPRILPDAYSGLVLAAMLYAVGGGLIEVLISPMVEALPGDAKASAMSLLHSFYCWGQMAVVLITTLLLWALGSGVWPFVCALWALVPFFNLFLFTRVPLAPPLAEGMRQTRLRDLLKSRAFIIALVLMMCAGASELTMSQWSSLFAEKGLGVSKVVGDLLGPCLFAVLMGLGRMLYGLFGERINLSRAMLFSGALCIACYSLTIFGGHPALSLVGCAVCGLSVALMWPGTLSMTAAKYPAGGTAMFGMMAVFGDLGASVGPWLAGLASDLAQGSAIIQQKAQTVGLSLEQMGLKSGLLLGCIFPMVMFVGVMMFRKSRA